MLYSAYTLHSMYQHLKWTFVAGKTSKARKCACTYLLSSCISHLLLCCVVLWISPGNLVGCNILIFLFLFYSWVHLSFPAGSGRNDSKKGLIEHCWYLWAVVSWSCFYCLNTGSSWASKWANLKRDHVSSPSGSCTSILLLFSYHRQAFLQVAVEVIGKGAILAYLRAVVSWSYSSCVKTGFSRASLQ